MLEKILTRRILNQEVPMATSSSAESSTPDKLVVGNAPYPYNLVGATGAPINIVSSQNIPDFRLDNLRENLAEVQQQLRKLQAEAGVNAELALHVRNLSQLVEKAQVNSQELKAPILLPPLEDMQVRLVASHSLERLEEYRSDESKYYLFVGLFGGAILGILSNWFTNEQLIMTRFSIVFIILLSILAGGCAYMVMNIHWRAKAVQTKMFGSNATPLPLADGDAGMGTADPGGTRSS
jgi:hypothetical protein